MYDRLIVASGDQASLDGWRGIAELLKLEFAPQARITGCLDTDELLLVYDQGNDSRDLILAETGVPAGRRHARDGVSGMPVIDLIESLQKRDASLACVLIGPGCSDTYDRLTPLPRCHFLPLTRPNKQDCIKSLRAFVADLAQPAPVQREVAAEEWALIDVNIGAGTSSVTVHIGRGNESFPGPTEPLHLDAKKLEAIIVSSRNLRKEFSDRLADPERRGEQLNQWQCEYEALGVQVFELLIGTPFAQSWFGAKGLSGRRRLRFTLGGSAYDAMWEAIRIPWARTHPWLMLEGTIARRVHADVDPDVRQLDGGDGCVNVLVILADCGEGSSLEGPDDDGWSAAYRELVDRARHRFGVEPESASDLFPSLENLADELRALKSLEQPDVKYKSRLAVEVLRSDGGTDVPLWERVRKALTESPIPQGRKYRYDVVHFAGHALFADGVEQSGYLIFGDIGESRAVPIAEFADWLRAADVQLAYLSCCRSSASRAALELAYTGVPLAIGFAWDLETRKAVTFAKKFYSHLLETDLKVCQAFHKARYQLHRYHQERDSIWAAPVFVAQPERWEKVETCFTRSQPIH